MACRFVYIYIYIQNDMCFEENVVDKKLFDPFSISEAFQQKPISWSRQLRPIPDIIYQSNVNFISGLPACNVPRFKRQDI